MDNWPEIRAWRRATRERLVAERLALDSPARAVATEAVDRHLIAARDSLPLACVGYYWPFRGEIDLHATVARLVAGGGRAALPVVVEKGAPLVFRGWRPGEALARGVWDIPVPAAGPVLTPSLLLVPLVGFDAAGYRLGYGGGFYDRTLAALAPRPLAIGIGHARARLESICPQPHDIPMDRILTEEGWFDVEGPRAPASSPCGMGEAPAGYMGFLEPVELLGLLDDLIAAERAGARAVAAMVKEAAPGPVRELLAAVVTDEARFVGMLAHHAQRLGGVPTAATGDFLGKVLALDAPDARLALLNRGQAWVARRLRESLPRIADPALARDLRAMLAVHERNLEACTRVLDAGT